MEQNKLREKGKKNYCARFLRYSEKRYCSLCGGALRGRQNLVLLYIVLCKIICMHNLKLVSRKNNKLSKIKNNINVHGTLFSNIFKK